MNKKSKESFWNSNSRFFGKDIPNKNLFAGILVLLMILLVCGMMVLILVKMGQALSSLYFGLLCLR
jgi:hypothetical protein